MAKIYRDDYGIPHIMATTSFDAAKAIAYVHSEDDFYTLQLWFLAIKFKSGHFDDWDVLILIFFHSFSTSKVKHSTCFQLFLMNTSLLQIHIVVE